MKIRTTVTLDEELLKAIEKKAKEENRSVSNFIESAISQLLGIRVAA